jgi:hypothetical protein
MGSRAVNPSAIRRWPEGWRGLSGAAEQLPRLQERPQRCLEGWHYVPDLLPALVVGTPRAEMGAVVIDFIAAGKLGGRFIDEQSVLQRGFSLRLTWALRKEPLRGSCAPHC